MGQADATILPFGTVSNDPRLHLLNLPPEIRLTIFYWAIFAHADLLSPKQGTFLAFNNMGEVEMRPNFPPEENCSPGNIFCDPWGTRRMASIFPVCRQWYNEIQVAMYSRFWFTLPYDIVTRMWKPFAFSFLPLQAHSLIRRLRYAISVDWTREILSGNQAEMITDYQTVADNLSGLVDLTLSFEHDGCRKWDDYINQDMEDKFVETVLAMVRPFKHVPRLRVEPVLRYCPAESMLLYKRLLLKVISILEDEIKVERRTESYTLLTNTPVIYFHRYVDGECILSFTPSEESPE